MSNVGPDVSDDAANHLLEEYSDHPIEQFSTGDDEGGQSQLSSSPIHRLLYVSHFLSTWNSRAFEFGAFLFLATIYPQTLLPASVYALTRAGSAAILSPWLGGYIDHGKRLPVVRLSIIGQRASVALSCLILFSMCQFEALQTQPEWSYSALAVLSVLACVEKLAAVLNTISVERDWVVVIAQDNEEHLRTMNSQMRRIDLFCKLVGPLFISLIDAASSRIAILVTGGMTAISVLIEYFAIARVHSAVPALRHPKPQSRPKAVQTTAFRRIAGSIFSAIESTGAYTQHRAFLPSFSLALLYLTVLSFNGQMITYLLAIGFKSAVIGILRGVSALFELSATWIAPKIMERIGPVRSGIWFISWEILCVSIACLLFWLPQQGEGTSTIACAAGTVAAVIASRIGLWGFDLSAQIIVQEEVEPELRGTFSSQEFAFQNVFEMLSFASTIVFARPEEFRVPATISAAAVGVAGVLYALSVRIRRGHLVHLSRCMEREGKGRRGRDGSMWEMVPLEEGYVPGEQGP